MKQKYFILILLLFLQFATFAQTATVKAVHDADSYKVQFDDGRIRWVRLYGVDAPEVVSNKISKDQPYGRQAANNIRALIKGRQVRIDSVTSDIYNRLVAKVYLDTIDLTVYTISTGNAWWLNNANIKPEEFNRLKALQEVAKKNKLGLWALPGTKQRPSTFRRNNRR